MNKLVKNAQSFLRRQDMFCSQGTPPDTHKGLRNLWLDSLLASMSGAFLFTYVPLFALALGATNAQIGNMSSAASLMTTLAPIPGAQWTNRLGKRRQVVVITWSVIRSLPLLMILIPFLLQGQAAVYALIVLWSLRAGLVNLAHPAWVSLSADVIPQDRRGRFLSSRNMAMAVSSLLFVPLAGQIVGWIGEPQGYQWSFALSTVFGFAALYFYRQIPEPPMARSTEKKGAGRVFWQALTGNRMFLLFTLTRTLFNFAWQFAGPFFTVYQVKVLGATPSMVGLLSVASSLSRLVGHRVWGRVVDRKGPRWVFTLCTLLIPVLPFIWFFLQAPWQLVFVSIPSGFLWAGFNLANLNLLFELPKPEHRTQATAVFTTLIGVANIAAPLLGALVIDRWGYLWTFGLSGAGRLVGGILFMLLLRPFSWLAKKPKTCGQE